MNKEIDLKIFLIVLTILIIAEVIILYSFNAFKKNRIEAERKEHCALAVCNESKTMCYNYELDSDGKTTITWRGSCAKD